MISRVSGFYSNWSPSIFTNFIKVLTDSHKIEGFDASFKIPFLIGEVGSFRLTLNTLNSLNVKHNSQKFDFEQAFKEPELYPEYLETTAKEAEQLKEESRARLVTDTAGMSTPKGWHQRFRFILTQASSNISYLKIR